MRRGHTLHCDRDIAGEVERRNERSVASNVGRGENAREATASTNSSVTSTSENTYLSSNADHSITSTRESKKPDVANLRKAYAEQCRASSSDEPNSNRSQSKGIANKLLLLIYIYIMRILYNYDKLKLLFVSNKVYSNDYIVYI